MITFDTDVHAHAWQHTTIVDPDHRGRRLGMLLKLENPFQTLAFEPRLRHIDTWNAAEMTPTRQVLARDPCWAKSVNKGPFLTRGRGGA